MADRAPSKETWNEINETVLKIKRRARKDNDIEGIKDAERLDALLQGLGIDLMLEGWKAE